MEGELRFVIRNVLEGTFYSDRNGGWNSKWLDLQEATTYRTIGAAKKSRGNRGLKSGQSEIVAVKLVLEENL